MSEKFNRKRLYKALGLMSGTSLDGLDICAVEFWQDEAWHFRINKAITLPYSDEWQEKLRYKKGLNPNLHIREELTIQNNPFLQIFSR